MLNSFIKLGGVVLMSITLTNNLSGEETKFLKDDGYYGIWYFNQPSNDEYKFKYSGGLATYPQQMNSFAYYSKEVNKTFFCYGGTTHDGSGKRSLLHMVSYYDHSTGMVPKPTILLNKKTRDAHDNPIIMLDDKGYVWIFSNSHGTARPSFIHKSKNPYDVNDFVLISTTNFSYGNIWHFPEKGFLFLHTLYSKGRGLFWTTSSDGIKWSEAKKLSFFGMGHYQISWFHDKRVGTAFNYHPEPVGLNARTNLYYLQTDDMGNTWKNVKGEKVLTPLTTEQNPTLVHDYRAEGLLVYLKNMQFDNDEQPVIFYLTSKGYASGPQNNPRILRTARWTGSDWEIRDATTTDNNYDYGPLYIEPDGTWRIIAPTESGPQPYNPGGEVVMWTSGDKGKTWTRTKQLTKDSIRNHTYVRIPVNAHPAFYAIWADGNAREESESFIYFTNKTGDHVWQLPTNMKSDFEKPKIAW